MMYQCMYVIASVLVLLDSHDPDRPLLIVTFPCVWHLAFVLRVDDHLPDGFIHSRERIPFPRQPPERFAVDTLSHLRASRFPH